MYISIFHCIFTVMWTKSTLYDVSHLDSINLNIPTMSQRKWQNYQSVHISLDLHCSTVDKLQEPALYDRKSHRQH